MSRWCIMLSMLLFSPVYGHPGLHEQIGVITEAIEQKPDEQALYIRRGAIYSAEQQYQQALADFRQAERLGPPLAVAFDMGVLHYRMKKYTEARTYLDRYLSAFPDAARAYEYRARVGRDADDYQRAIADYRRYLDLTEQPNPGSYLAVADMLAAEGHIAEALAILDQGSERLGVTPQLQGRAVELAVSRGDVSDAIARQETLRAPLGESPNWKIDMAELQLLDGQQTAAGQLLDSAIADLKKLRPTPARLEQLQQANQLKTRIGAS